MDKIIFLTFKKYEIHFRKYLIKSLIKGGYDVLYVFLLPNQIDLYFNEKLVNSYAFKKVKSLKFFFKISPKIIKQIKDFKKNEEVLIWNSLGLSSLIFYLILRFSIPKSFVIYDVYDYLFYNEKNKKQLLKLKLIDKIYRLLANRTIVLSRELTHLYPEAYWLNNASHLHRKKSGGLKKRIGMTGSINYNFDFHLTEHIAKKLPEIEIAIHGWIRSYDMKETQRKINYLVTTYSNIKYYGEYNNDNMEDILSTLDIALVVYIPDSVIIPGSSIIKYSNPDKFFHYLCYGLEVISTPIKPAYELKKWVHICGTAECFVEKIKDIYGNKGLKNEDEFWKENHWDNRLQDIKNNILK